jgi:outer membrane lipoprotein carrier protein
VSDGTRLWIYTPELRQVNVSAAPAALAGPAGSFLEGLGQVREHFQPRFLNPAQPTDAEGLIVLDLAPKQRQPLLARLIISVDPRSWLVRQAVVHDELGNTVTVRFGETTVNSGLPDALFVFVPPPGVAIVQH